MEEESRSRAGVPIQDFAQATNLLLDHGITLIEWGDQILVQHGYPAVIHSYKYLIKDSEIAQAASLIETQTAFQRVPPSPGARAFGVIGISGYHFVSKNDHPRWPTRLHLLPESLVHLSSTGNDTEPAASRFDSSRQFLRPKLPQDCASLVKCMEEFPKYSGSWMAATLPLWSLIVAAIYKEPDPGRKIWEPEELTESEEQFRVRQAEAVKFVEGWEFDEEDEPYRRKLIKILMNEPLD
ncbi:hypothetical protein TWF696_004787 [Orbilia brochopaga]|uniref:Uncharacterized protein n=1 Tax=Orbilia brochopaga TaxID=3140254 RepID=A0AAV9UZJ0_9PEZI